MSIHSYNCIRQFASSVRSSLLLGEVSARSVVATRRGPLLHHESVTPCLCWLQVLDAMVQMGVLVPTGDMIAVRRTAQFFLNR